MARWIGAAISHSRPSSADKIAFLLTLGQDEVQASAAREIFAFSERASLPFDWPADTRE